MRCTAYSGLNPLHYSEFGIRDSRPSRAPHLRCGPGPGPDSAAGVGVHAGGGGCRIGSGGERRPSPFPRAVGPLAPLTAPGPTPGAGRDRSSLRRHVDPMDGASAPGQRGNSARKPTPLPESAPILPLLDDSRPETRARSAPQGARMPLDPSQVRPRPPSGETREPIDSPISPVRGSPRRAGRASWPRGRGARCRRWLAPSRSEPPFCGFEVCSFVATPARSHPRRSCRSSHRHPRVWDDRDSATTETDHAGVADLRRKCVGLHPPCEHGRIGRWDAVEIS
jgi:hypothetical protein